MTPCATALWRRQARCRLCGLSVLAVLLITAVAAVGDGPATLVADVAPGIDPGADSDPHDFIVFDGVALFAAADHLHGTELWRTDGTSDGTALVKDIMPGFVGSEPSSLIGTAHGVIFAAADPVHGRELWRTDGTSEGTVLLKDLAPGSADSYPSQFFRFGDVLLFTAADEDTGVELWRTDGSEAGTVRVADISPGPRSSGPQSFTLSGGRVFFVADDGTHGCELWRTDGTAAGTVLVKDTYPTDECVVPLSPYVPFMRDVTPRSLTDVNGALFFTANETLWVSDGTEAGTVSLQTYGLCHGFEQFSCPPSCLTAVDGVLYFQAETEVGRELWKSDGSIAGTTLVKDINPQPCEYNAYADRCSSFPCGFQMIDGAVSFTARDGDLEYGRWTTDGTADGTVPAPPITPTPGMNPPAESVLLSGTLIFGDGELYRSDGTPDGGVLLKDINQRPADSYPAFVAELDGEVLFFADDRVHGAELWRTDGSAAGTALVKDILVGTRSSVESVPIRRGVRVADEVLFVADDGRSGPELWKTDGTGAGTTLVADILPGPEGGLVGTAYIGLPELACAGDLAFFAARGTGTGVELWRSDGTADGTRLVKDIRAGEQPSFPQSFVDLDGVLLFSADDGVHGRELWRSDGTDAGTTLVADIFSGPSWSFPFALRRIGHRVLFSASDAAHGSELWISDGTEAGTRMVRDIQPGEDSSSPQELTAVGDVVYFVADDGVHGPSLWRSDGSEDGTRMVKDLTAGTQGHFVASLTASGGLLFFNAGDEQEDEELWVSDGTEAGTHRVADLNPARSAFPTGLTDAGGVLLFLADDGLVGARLWRSDGTAAGTFPVQRFDTSGATLDTFAYPDAAVVAPGRVFFAADDMVSGHELWSLPLDAVAGQCVGDCSGDGAVSIDELLLGVNIVLGHQSADACAALVGDPPISAIIQAVDNALAGCRRSVGRAG